MLLSRRNVLKTILAGAVLAPLPALAAGADVSLIEYSGADDPAVFQKFLTDQSRDAVIVSVFHAKWCGPCKTLFSQLEDIRKQPGIKIKIVGLDVGPPDPAQSPFLNILRASQYKGTPQVHILADGNSQYKTRGYFQNVPDMMRYLRDLSQAVHGDIPPVPRP